MSKIAKIEILEIWAGRTGFQLLFPIEVTYIPFNRGFKVELEKPNQNFLRLPIRKKKIRNYLLQWICKEHPHKLVIKVNEVSLDQYEK